MSDSNPARPADPNDSPGLAHYRGLIEQSNAARAAGRHGEAQQLASAAHKWSMDERIRLQRLAQALASLKDARGRLETAWDKDRSCATVAELGVRHPEMLRLIAACTEAEERVAFFAICDPEAESLPANPIPRRSTRVARGGQDQR